MSKYIYESYDVGTLTVRFLDVKFTTLTPLPFPIAGLKMSSLPTLALKSPNKFSYGILAIYQIHVLVLRGSVPYIINFILCRGMYIQNNDTKPAIS
jgi:hypothetical protein